MKKIGNKYIFYIVVYLLVCIFLYYFGPLRYKYVNNMQVVTILFLYILMFVVGYLMGFKFTKVKSRLNYFNRLEKDLEVRLFYIGTFVSFVFALINIISVFGTLSPSIIYNQLILGLNNATDLYAQTLESSQSSTGGIVTQLQTLLSPITYLSVPLGIFYYSEIKNKKIKIFWAFTVVLNLIANIMTGTNIGVFRIVISGVAVLYVLSLQNRFNHYRNSSLKTKIIGWGFLIFFVLIFLNNVTSRMPKLGAYLGVIYIDYDNWLLQLIPESFINGAILMLSYLTQGFYGFSLMFNYRWTPTFPFGNSIFLMNYTDLIGINFNETFSKTYISKMASEWSPTINWHTAFTWLANDLSPYGVIFLMFFIGLFIGIFFRESIKGSSISLLLFSLSVIFIIFLPMNNIVLSNPLTFMPLITYFVIFFIRYQIVFIKRR